MKNKKNEINTNNCVNTKKQNNIGFYAIVVLLILIILASSTFGIIAWAKYRSAIGGVAEAQIAKWHFELKEGVTENTGNTLMALTRTDGYKHVAEGKLAPGTNGELPIIIDTTKTQVDLTYDLVVTITNFPQNMLLYSLDGTQIKPTVTGEGTDTDPRVATIKVSKYVPWETEDTDRLHDETIKWNWEYETGTGVNEINANDDIDTKDAGKMISVSISVTGTEVLEEPEQTASTPVSSLTSTDYGKYVNIGTSILGKDNITEADWRVFYKDSSGGVWLMLSDYLPVDSGVGASTVSSVGLETSGTYIVFSNISTEDLTKKLNGDWSSLISGSDVAGKEDVEVKGAVDLEKWVASWNDTYPTKQLYISGDNTDGYRISDSYPPANSDYGVTVTEEYITESETYDLYHSHGTEFTDCNGYWLASRSAMLWKNQIIRQMCTNSAGGVVRANYNATRLRRSPCSLSTI